MGRENLAFPKIKRFSMPRQHSYKMVRKPVFTRVSVTMGWHFRTNLGQKAWCSDKKVMFFRLICRLLRVAVLK